MKKIITLLMLLCVSMAGCSHKTPTDTVGQIDEQTAALLTEMGISEEEFNSYDQQQQEAILNEMNIANAQKENQQQESTSSSLSVSDVESGGHYVVTVGDESMLNYFKLYYEDGKLVKMEISFQKSYDEEASVEIVEGDAIGEYSLFFLDYDVEASQLINDLNQKGYTKVHIQKQ